MASRLELIGDSQGLVHISSFHGVQKQLRAHRAMFLLVSRFPPVRPARNLHRARRISAHAVE